MINPQPSNYWSKIRENTMLPSECVLTALLSLGPWPPRSRRPSPVRAARSSRAVGHDAMRTNVRMMARILCASPVRVAVQEALLTLRPRGAHEGLLSNVRAQSLC